MATAHMFFIISQYHRRLITSIVGLISDGFSLRSLGLSGFIGEIEVGFNCRSLQQELS